LDVLEGAAKILVAVAAYSGLRRGEIIALKWSDYDGETLSVRRNISFDEKGKMCVELPKTAASQAPVFVGKQLIAILDDWKAKTVAEVGAEIDGLWMFPAEFTRKVDHDPFLLDAMRRAPINPQNILRDGVVDELEKAGMEWRGFHAFRRGLATQLRAKGIPDIDIADALRHSDVAITRKSYIKRVPQRVVDAMKLLDE
jgi:integrase